MTGKKMTAAHIKEIVALLPMKAHSERVPNKNVRDFCGRPLYHHVLSSLLGSRYISKVIINTDSEVIAREAPKLSERVQVIERPERLRGDLVPMNDIITHDVASCNAEHFIQTHSTNPLLRADTVDRAVEAYFSDPDTYDSLFSVTRIQTRLYWADGRPINHDPRELLRTQDLPPVFEENSNLYIFSRKSFHDAGNRRIGLRPMMFETDPLESVDIDEEEDFILAQAVYALKHGG